MRAIKDELTGDLFAVPEPERPSGTSDYGLEVSHLVSEALKDSVLDRWDVAARMSRALGVDVSKNHVLTDWLVQKRGGRVAYGADVLQAELGKLEVLRDEAARKIRRLKRIMGEVE